MSIDFTDVKAVTVPEGAVKKITRKSDSAVLWEKPLEQIAEPAVTSSLTYTGSVQYPTVIGYDSNTMTRGGDVSAINAGTYTVTYTPKDGCRWTDGTTETKSYTWSIAKAQVAKPSTSSSFTYSGSAQTPAWSNYDSTKVTIGGDTNGINAGTYTTTFTLKDTVNYTWNDGTNAVHSVTWSIAKAAGSLSISPTSITLDSSNTSKTITVTRVGDGAISAVSSDTSVATVSVSGNVVTVNSVNDKTGTATITVSVAEGTNWKAATDVTCSVSAEFTTLITFTIELNSTVETFTAEEGMTWSEWMDSSYNTMGFYSNWSQVSYGQGADVVFVLNSDNTNVWDNSLIEDGAAYHTAS